MEERRLEGRRGEDETKEMRGSMSCGNISAY